MLSWLSSIGNSFVVFIQFLISTLSGILSVFGLIAQSLVFLALSWGYLPSVLLVFAVAGVSIIVVFQLIGR